MSWSGEACDTAGKHQPRLAQGDSHGVGKLILPGIIAGCKQVDSDAWRSVGCSDSYRALSALQPYCRHAAKSIATLQDQPAQEQPLDAARVDDEHHETTQDGSMRSPGPCQSHDDDALSAELGLPMVSSSFVPTQRYKVMLLALVPRAGDPPPETDVRWTPSTQQSETKGYSRYSSALPQPGHAAFALFRLPRLV